MNIKKLILETTYFDECRKFNTNLAEEIELCPDWEKEIELQALKKKQNEALLNRIAKRYHMDKISRIFRAFVQNAQANREAKAKIAKLIMSKKTQNLGQLFQGWKDSILIYKTENSTNILHETEKKVKKYKNNLLKAQASNEAKYTAIQALNNKFTDLTPKVKKLKILVNDPTRLPQNTNTIASFLIVLSIEMSKIMHACVQVMEEDRFLEAEKRRILVSPLLLYKIKDLVNKDLNQFALDQVDPMYTSVGKWVSSSISYIINQSEYGNPEAGLSLLSIYLSISIFVRAFV